MDDTRVNIDPDGDTLILLPPDQKFGSQNNIKNHRRHFFKVSMKQLLKASSYVKYRLDGPFQEIKPQADGLRYWKFDPIFDPEAFKIVMSIFHAQFREIPDIVSLEMLSNIALIVDELRCAVSVRHVGKLWLTELDKDIDPDEDVEYDGITCARNIFISEIFGLRDRTEWAGKMAIFWSPDIYSRFELPIHPYIPSKEPLKRVLLVKS
ncbi:hypothetical protein TRIATDRAFT_45781 [Trichoderma atroviride IMI 206040]|uniref:BTB domain-containing protein n=1 Tax=Hypocrea atroviridis (strain ATCC 20476 / IMI 206040) TaxID=452589 RepID=G9NQY3_HYPAI|nr:uncharacterized protein TRIATDRAFT_45781 [Trichoderma atroviride IMI 206040]EHK46953.1 hypothetical protein TRIATDRAFT_45781 [Trichoderma atroviride IMI 206040]